MVESDWNMSLATLYSVRKGMDMCNEGMDKGNYVLWLKGLYWLLQELSPFMEINDISETLALIDSLKPRIVRSRDFETNFQMFFEITMKLRREAHSHKLLLKEAEDTTKHGGM